MTEFLAEALEKELDYGVKELVIILPVINYFTSDKVCIVVIETLS